MVAFAYMLCRYLLIPMTTTPTTNPIQRRTIGGDPRISLSAWRPCGEGGVCCAGAGAESAATESWRKVFGLGDYEVSSSGLVRSLKPSRGAVRSLLLKQTITDGYFMVSVSRNGVAKKFPVHRLVAAAFLEKKDGRLVRHINGNPLDNRAENLAFGSDADNAADRTAHGRTYRGSSERKLSDAQRFEILASKEKVRDLCLKYSVSDSTIANAVKWAKKQLAKRAHGGL